MKRETDSTPTGIPKIMKRIAFLFSLFACLTFAVLPYAAGAATGKKSSSSKTTGIKSSAKTTVSTKSAKPAPPAAGCPVPGTRVLVNVAKASLRKNPAMGSTALRQLTILTPLEVVGAEGSYVKVKTSDGVTGHVHISYLSKNDYVSTSNSAVKVRSGPNPNDTALFSLKEHYPLRVLEKRGDRVRVEDYEGDGGWVHENMLSFTNYVIAKEKSINLREGPGVQHAKRFIADRGALFRVMDEKDGWLRVKHADGDEGWCSAKIVWGYSAN